MVLPHSPARAGAWLLDATAETLAAAGLPAANTPLVLLRLSRFRLKCATVGLQSLFRARAARAAFATTAQAPKKLPEQPAATPAETAEATRTDTEAKEDTKEKTKEEDAESREMRVRDSAAREILTTERSYNQQLAVMDDLLYTPLMARARDERRAVITETEVRLLFSDVQVLRSISTSFLRSLEERFRCWDGARTRLGDIFLGMMPFFRVYADYSRNYDKAISYVAAQPRTAPLRAFFRAQIAKAPTAALRSMDLASLLIVPVQRIPRYPLLLKELLKHTPATHPDHADLGAALAGIAQVAGWVNEFVRKGEEARMCVRLSRELVGMDEPLLVASRTFVREGEVVELAPADRPRRRVLLLFSDILVVADPKYDGPFFAPTRATPGAADAAAGSSTSGGGGGGAALGIAPAGTDDTLDTGTGTLLGTRRLKPRFHFVAKQRLATTRLDDAEPFSADFPFCFSVRRDRPGEQPTVYAAENAESKAAWLAALSDTIAQRRDVEERMDRYKDQAAASKADLVKAMLGAKYRSTALASSGSALASSPLRKSREQVWRTLRPEEKEALAQKAREYARQVEESAAQQEAAEKGHDKHTKRSSKKRARSKPKASPESHAQGTAGDSPQGTPRTDEIK